MFHVEVKESKIVIENISNIWILNCNTKSSKFCKCCSVQNKWISLDTKQYQNINLSDILSSLFVTYANARMHGNKSFYFFN